MHAVLILMKVKLFIFLHAPIVQGEENVDNDFYFKESPDGSVVFESVPNKGKFITVPCGKQLIRNFNINLLVCVYMYELN